MIFKSTNYANEREFFRTKTYVADFVARGRIIVEVKAFDRLTSREETPVMNCLKASGFGRGRVDQLRDDQP